MATKKKEAKAQKAVDPEKLAKRKARLEAIKNRPAEQRPNSKQIDVIDLGNGSVVKNFGYAVKNREGHLGVLVTSVVEKNGEAVSTSVAFIPGNITIKVKKGHGAIVNPKSKKASDEEEEEADSED